MSESKTGEECVAQKLEAATIGEDTATSAEGTDAAKQAKKAAKQAEKQQKEAEKERKRQEREQQQSDAKAALELKVNSIEEGPFGYLPLCRSHHRTGRQFAVIANLAAADKDHKVWVRGWLQESRLQGRSSAFIVRRTIRCLVATTDD
eukprot:GHVU01031331.1.p3 GENE.GHVU01031331.1~~GHVU01031331.1.p3  ORF type:complete len:148 (-),score=25.00 GHVU01031331.1:1932-2375(-)